MGVEKVGPYLVLRTLGGGGMGSVYVAEHCENRRRVALKTVRLPTPDLLASLRLEIAALTRIRHPGIVEVVDHGVCPLGPWYAMELLEGETLADRHRSIWLRSASEASTTAPAHLSAASSSQAGPNTTRSPPAASQAAANRLPEILSIYLKICTPLAFLHGNGIVHRDLKPANVFLRPNDKVVLMDFGLTAMVGGMVGREVLSAAGGIRGTLPYLAPEIIRGQIPDVRADLYALGCMLWESLTGRPPFEAPTAAELLKMHLSLRPGRPSDLVAGLPRALDDLIVMLLEKDPHKRVGHAADVAEALVEIEGAGRSGGNDDRARGGTYMFRPQLVGRDSALRDLLSWQIVPAMHETGRLTFIAGESGIGKTFLATEVAQRAALNGVRVVTGECVAVATGDAAEAERGGAPLHAFRNLLQAAGDRCRQVGLSETERLFGSDLKLFVPYEPGLAALEGVDRAPEPAVLPGEAARERLLAALRRMLVAYVGDSTTLLVLDDLQWADDLSLAFLESLDERLFSTMPLVFIAIYRVEEAREAIQRLTARSWTSTIQLGRLDDASVDEMVAQMLAMAAPPQALGAFVRRHAEGIPFFVAEYLRAAIDKGALLRRGGRWSLGAGDNGAIGFAQIGLPKSLEGLVRLRLSGLTPTTTTAAETAAVIGREFDTGTLARASRTHPSLVARALVELVGRQVIEGAGPERFRFLHDRIREAAYAGVEPSRRKHLHLDVAAALEAPDAEPGAADLPFAELAYHYRAADRLREAAQYSAKAGDQASRVSADGDAVRHFHEALDIEKALDPRVPAAERSLWERKLGDALQGLGRLTDSAAPLALAAADLGRPLPRSKILLSVGILGAILRQLWHRLAPSRLARVGLSAGVFLESSRVFDGMQRVFYYTGQSLQLVFANLTALNLAERAGPSPELAMAYGSAAAMAIMIPLRKLARTYFRLAFQTLEKAPSPAVESHVRLLLGLYHNCLGEAAESARETEKAMELARQSGFERRRDEAASLRVGVDLVPSRPELAMKWISDMENSATQRGDSHILVWALLLRAECSILRGRVGDAHEILLRVEALRTGLGRQAAIWSLATLAYVAWRLDDLPAAERYAAEATSEVVKGPPADAACMNAYSRLAEVRLELWRHSPPAKRRAAGRHAAQACAILNRATRVFPIITPMAALHRARHALLSGRRDNARRLLEQGLEKARVLKNDYASARLMLALAETLPENASARFALIRTAWERLTEWKIGELGPPPAAGELESIAPAAAAAGAPPNDAGARRAPVHPAE